MNPKMEVKRKTEKLLSRDIIAETEKEFECPYQKFTTGMQAAALVNMMKHVKEKTAHLKEIGDTNNDMTWYEFQALLIQKGFKLALLYQFKYNMVDHDNTEEFVIYYHLEKGLIITATSFWNGATVNGGKLYGEVKAKTLEKANSVWQHVSTGGMVDGHPDTFEISHDVREGLFTKIAALEEHGNFLPRWINKDRFLWFCDFVETKVEGYDYQKINAEKIKCCPLEIQAIIGRC